MASQGSDDEAIELPITPVNLRPAGLAYDAAQHVDDGELIDVPAAPPAKGADDESDSDDDARYVDRFFGGGTDVADAPDTDENSSGDGDDSNVADARVARKPPVPIARAKALLAQTTPAPVSKEAAWEAAFATEVFIQELVGAATAVMRRHNKKQVTYDHIAEVVHTQERFAFLGEVVPANNGGHPQLFQTKQA